MGDSDIRTVEYFVEDWATRPKHKVFEEVGTDGTTWIGFASKVGRFQVWVFGNIGKKGGISEEVYIIDPTQRIVVDRLRLAERIVAGDGHFLPLRNMRNRVRRGDENPIRVVRECVAESLSRIQAGEFTESRIATLQEKTSAMPCCFVSAGLGSLGKRS